MTRQVARHPLLRGQKWAKPAGVHTRLWYMQWFCLPALASDATPDPS